MAKSRWVKRTPKGTQLVLELVAGVEALKTGESLAVNGCCLTVTSVHGRDLSFDVLEETLKKTNLGSLEQGDLVNLERPLGADGRLGGHFVQGHVDCVTTVVSYERSGADFRLEVKLPSEFARYVAYKGSVAVNGISLTIAEVLEESFVIWIIPHTHKVTNFSIIKAGDPVNLEFDILAKYLERMVQLRE